MPARLFPPRAATLKAPSVLPAANPCSKLCPRAQLLPSYWLCLAQRVTFTKPNSPTECSCCCWDLMDTHSPVLETEVLLAATPAHEADKLTSQQFIAHRHFSRHITNWKPVWIQNYPSPVAEPCSKSRSVPRQSHTPSAASAQHWCSPGTFWDALQGLWVERSEPLLNTIAITPRSGLRKLATWVNVRGSCTYYIPIIFWQTFPSIMRYRKRGLVL